MLELTEINRRMAVVLSGMMAGGALLTVAALATALLVMLWRGRRQTRTKTRTEVQTAIRKAKGDVWRALDSLETSIHAANHCSSYSPDDVLEFKVEVDEMRDLWGRIMDGYIVNDATSR